MIIFIVDGGWKEFMVLYNRILYKRLVRPRKVVCGRGMDYLEAIFILQICDMVSAL